jgi:hypothetical protein
MPGLARLFLHSRSESPRLRIVAIADGSRLGRPEAAALKHIQSSDFATLLAVAMPPSGAVVPIKPAAKDQLAFKLVEEWDHCVYPDVRALVEPVDCSSLFARLPVLPTSPADASGSLAFSAQTIAAIQALQPDVILHCAPGPVPTTLAPVARFGIWSIHLAQPNQPRPLVPYFREVDKGELLSGVALLMYGGPLGGVHILTHAQVATEHSLFRGKNGVRPVLTALTFVIRKLHDLHERGWEKFAETLQPLPQPPVATNATPGNLEMLKFLAPRALRRVANLVHPPRQSFRWRLALRSGYPCKLVDQAKPEGLSAFRWVSPRQGGYFADPFLIHRDGHLWLFCEELSYLEGKGALSCMEVLPDGQLTEPVRVLTRPYHISYPAVFESDGDVFMIPETVQSGKVELYHAVSFPHSWVKVRDLLSIRAADCTPFFHEGRHWLFVPAIDPAEASTQLLLFHAIRPDGEWTLHPSSPISLDVRHARCAGAIVFRDGKLFRPSQDCAPYYGHQLNIHQITHLDPDHYQERLVHALSPETWPGMRGVHTYATYGDIEVIDGQQ